MERDEFRVHDTRNQRLQLPFHRDKNGLNALEADRGGGAVQLEDGWRVVVQVLTQDGTH